MNYEKPGRVLGVDLGDVRTGLAVSDEGRFLASGIGTIAVGGMRKTAERIAREVSERNVRMVVIGLPKNMDGSEGARAQRVRIFGDILAPLIAVPVTYFDERLSTVEAHGFLNETETGGKKRKAVIDTLSAQIILQDFLDASKKDSTGK